MLAAHEATHFFDRVGAGDFTLGVATHAVGDDVPIPGCEGRGGKGTSLTLGDVLRALDSGESLVEIEDEDTTVRVWVE